MRGLPGRPDRRRERRRPGVACERGGAEVGSMTIDEVRAGVEGRRRGEPPMEPRPSARGLRHHRLRHQRRRGARPRLPHGRRRGPPRARRRPRRRSPACLRGLDILALPGGFSFGDHLGSGKVLAHLLPPQPAAGARGVRRRAAAW